MALKLTTLLCVLSLFCCGSCNGSLQLAPYFSSHMVLQKAPQQAVMWGTAATEGDTVTVKLWGQGHHIQVTTKVNQGQWKVKLPAQSPGGPYGIRVISSEGNVKIHDVMFGDVWLCSGQSNMAFSMSHIINSTEEIHTAANFSQVRFARVNLTYSATPQSSASLDVPWSTPDNRVLRYSSAVCFLFAEYLYPRVNYPIGLVEAYWGGTPIEAWSPPEAIAQCDHHQKRGPRKTSQLWNAMIHPILSTTIYGALWYQGEANAGHYQKYSCQIQAMVNEWRRQFNSNSLGQTSDTFPFGYVQLAALNANDRVGAFPGERWAQTANYGYSPNPALPHTFMAVAMDLPDYTSPSGPVHPRYKQDVAERLSLGALNVAYGMSNVTFQGPFPSSIIQDGAVQEMMVEYDKGQTTLDVRDHDGFEVCCNAHSATYCKDTRKAWVAAPIRRASGARVYLSTSNCGSRHVVGMRYHWRTSPCDLKMCTIYGAQSSLPAPPYITYSVTAKDGPTVIG